MKKMVAVIVSFVIIFSCFMSVSASNKNLMIVGTLPNGRAITAVEAICIQEKIDTAMSDAYKEKVVVTRRDIQNNTVPDTILKKEYLKKFLNENLIQISCEKYFLKTDADGVQIPVTNAEIKQNAMITHTYPSLIMIASVVDDGSTSTVRKYIMNGEVVMQDQLKNDSNLDDAVSISWSGGEAIVNDGGVAQYYTHSYGDTSHLLAVDGWRHNVINNGAVSYLFNGRYRYFLILRDPYYFAVMADVKQNGSKNKIYNMTSTYINTWLNNSYSFSIGTGGVSMSVSPVTGTATYTATCTY